MTVDGAAPIRARIKEIVPEYVLPQIGPPPSQERELQGAQEPFRPAFQS
jgi:hypothetical protein